MVSDRSVYVRVKGDISDFQRAMMAGSASAKAFTKDLDTSNDRTALLTQSLLAVGPALVPMTAAAIPAVSGLTNQLAFAAAGAGVMALAFSGVGDALKATNDYAVEPTEANLAKMKETMNELGPAGRDFVGYLQELRPQLQGLQDIAQEGLFPGVQSGIEDLMTRLPQVERIVEQVATGMGELIAEAGDNLADPRWDEFFTFLETEAQPTLMDMGRTLGNFVEGFANLWMAFEPVSSNFSRSFLDLSRDFSAWTDGLGETQGFQEFVDYLNRVGPKAWDTLGAIGGALLNIVEAAAPVGEVMLPIIEAVADSIGAIAGSDLGPAVVGILAITSAYSRLIALGQATGGSALGGLFGGTAIRSTVTSLKSVRVATDELAVARSRLSKSAGSTRDAQFALIPTGDKRGAVASYMKDHKAVADAEKSLADARKTRQGQMLKGAGAAAGLAFVMSDLDDKMGLSNTAMLGMAGAMAGPWGAAVGAGVGLVMDLSKSSFELGDSMKAAQQVMASGAGTLDQQAAAIKAARKEHEGFATAVAGIDFADDEVKKSAQALSELEGAYDGNVHAAQDLRFEEAGLGAAMQSASDDTRDQVEATLELIDAHNALANELLGSRDANRAYEQAIDDADAAAKKNGKTLDVNTQAGRDNEEALDRLAAAWNELTPAQQAAQGSSTRARKEFMSTAREMGATKTEAQALADQYLEIPGTVDTQISADAAAALARLDEVRRALLGIRSKTVYVNVEKGIHVNPGDIGGGTQMREADGGVLNYYANGGMRENHVAQIAPAGAWRVWAEDETGGEAYIPLSPAKRVRSRSIAEQTISILGGSVEWYANGGINDGQARYDAYNDLERSTRLDLVRKQREIRDIERALNEREKYGKKPKKGRDTRPTRRVLRGLDRTEAKLSLREAEKELAEMKRENAELKKYGTSKQEERRYERDQASSQAAEDAVKAAETVVREAAEKRASTKQSAAATFAIGSATSAAAVDRNLDRLLTDSAVFLGLLGELKAKNASPWLLNQLVEAGPTRGAIRLAREYNTNQAALDSINARAGQIDKYSDAYAGLVSDSRFTKPGGWASGVTSASTSASFTINAIDPTTFNNEMVRLIRHEFTTLAAGAGV